MTLRPFRRIFLASTALVAITIFALTVPVLAQEAETSVKRTPAPVMSFRGAPWLERETRDKEEQPYKVIETMDLEPGDVVADIGCGSGYYARKIAKVVGPEGKVYGVDIQPEMLDIMMELCDQEEIANVVPVLGDPNDPHLPKERVDWIILADVYHEFQAPEAMLAKLLECLKPDGKVALLEYRLKGQTAAHIKRDHRMSVEQVKSEWLPAGFELADLHEFLPAQHFFVFQKAAKKAE